MIKHDPPLKVFKRHGRWCVHCNYCRNQVWPLSGEWAFGSQQHALNEGLRHLFMCSLQALVFAFTQVRVRA